MIPLLVIRHFPTGWNAAGLIQGRADPPLGAPTRPHATPASAAAEWRQAACLSSPLRRAMDTARLLGLDPRPEPRLVEMDWGEWEGKRLRDLRLSLGATMAENEARGLDFRPPGGESPRDVQLRLLPLLDSLGEPTIFLTHKGVLRALYALATGWTMVAKPSTALRDGCAHSFRVRPDGSLAVAELNLPLTALR